MSFNRPILVLVDRNVDLSVPLHHPWTYQALCKDLLQLKSNRCTLNIADDAEQKGSNKTYDLSSEDQFWRANAGLPFPRVAEGVETALKKYQQDVQDLGINRPRDDVFTDEFEGDTNSLSTAINSLPALKRKKEQLDMHTQIATAILKEIKKRELDAYFSLEEDMIGRSVIDKKSVMQEIAPGSKGSPRDKLRMLLIYYLTSSSITDSDFAEFMSVLDWPNQPGVSPSDTYAADYLKQFKFTHRLAAADQPKAQQQSGGGLFGKLANMSATGLTGLVAGVKNLMPASTKLPLTKTVGELMDNKETSETDKYVYFDPKAAKPSEIRTGRQEKPFQDSFVFVLGGGTYTEYQNLQDYASDKKANPTMTRNIAYGTTELVSPEEFLEQLVLLGTPESQRGQVSVD